MVTDEGLCDAQMVEQVIIPDAVVEIADVVPGKHQQHAVQKFTVFERQCEDLRQFERRRLGIGIFPGAGLHEHIQQYQR